MIDASALYKADDDGETMVAAYRALDKKLVDAINAEVDVTLTPLEAFLLLEAKESSIALYSILNQFAPPPIMKMSVNLKFQLMEEILPQYQVIRGDVVRQ